MIKFIIGKNINEKQDLLEKGYVFFKEQEGEFWFLFNDKVHFNDNKYNIKEVINI